jgi:hypothetical protein
MLFLTAPLWDRYSQTHNSLVVVTCHVYLTSPPKLMRAKSCPFVDVIVDPAYRLHLSPLSSPVA